MLAPAAEMLVQQLTDPRWIEVPPLKRLRVKQDTIQVLFELRTHPVDQWQGEALLRTLQDRTRYTHSFGQLAKDEFLRPSTKLPVCRQRSNPLQEFVVEDR